MGRSQQAIDELFVGLWRRVRQELLGLSIRWRQPRKIEIESTKQGDSIRFGACHKPLLGDVGIDQGIDTLENLLIACGSASGISDFARQESPVTFVRTTLGNPFAEQFDLLGREFFTACRRRHVFLRILRKDSCDELALLRFTWNDCSWLVLFAVEAFKRIEPQVRFSLVIIRPMTKETIVR